MLVKACLLRRDSGPGLATWNEPVEGQSRGPVRLVVRRGDGVLADWHAEPEVCSRLRFGARQRGVKQQEWGGGDREAVRRRAKTIWKCRAQRRQHRRLALGMVPAHEHAAGGQWPPGRRGRLVAQHQAIPGADLDEAELVRNIARAVIVGRRRPWSKRTERGGDGSPCCWRGNAFPVREQGRRKQQERSALRGNPLQLELGHSRRFAGKR